jgi:hypothetical protein
MTLTIDLIESGALSLLQDMERLNLIRVTPPAENDPVRQIHGSKQALLDRKTAAEEMNRIRKFVEDMNYQPPSCELTDSLKEAIRRAQTETQARECQRMLDLLPAIDAIFDNDEGVRIIREMRNEWDRPIPAAGDG